MVERVYQTLKKGTDREERKKNGPIGDNQQVPIYIHNERDGGNGVIFDSRNKY